MFNGMTLHVLFHIHCLKIYIEYKVNSFYNTKQILITFLYEVVTYFSLNYRHGSLPQQLCDILLSEEQTEYTMLLHLSVASNEQLFERAVKVMQEASTKVSVCLHWDQGGTARVCLIPCYRHCQASVI